MAKKSTFPASVIMRGEIYWVDIPNAIGHELMKDRPAIIVSCDALNDNSPVVQVVYAQWERQVIPMEWNIIVGLVCTVLGAVISYATFSRNKGKDDRSSGQQLGTVLTELGYIKSNTDEIKTEQREQRKTNTAVEGRLAAVEASAKSAHHRIDHLEAVRDEEH